MKCPKCDKEIARFDDVCPHCKTDLFEYQKNNKTEDNTILKDGTKTTFIKYINIFQLIGLIIVAIISWSKEEIALGFVYLIIGLVIFAFIKGFSDIIDLLESINNKLSK